MIGIVFSSSLIESGVAFNLLLQEHRNEFLNSFFLLLSKIGTSYSYITLIALLVVFWKRDLGLKLYFAFLINNLINNVSKVFFALPRPFDTDPRIIPLDHVESLSFPSGHAQSAGLIWLYLFFLLKEKWQKLFCFFLLIGIPFSRNYLGVHYYFDVLAGLGLGSILAFLIFKFEVQKKQKLSMSIFAILIGTYLAPNSNTFILSSALLGIVLSDFIQTSKLSLQPLKITLKGKQILFLLTFFIFMFVYLKFNVLVLRALLMFFLSIFLVRASKSVNTYSVIG